MDDQTPDTIDTYLQSLSRSELQALAKKHQVKANQKSVVIIEELQALFHEAYGNESEEEFAESVSDNVDVVQADEDECDSHDMSFQSNLSPLTENTISSQISATDPEESSIDIHTNTNPQPIISFPDEPSSENDDYRMSKPVAATPPKPARIIPVDDAILGDGYTVQQYAQLNSIKSSRRRHRATITSSIGSRVGLHRTSLAESFDEISTSNDQPHPIVVRSPYSVVSYSSPAAGLSTQGRSGHRQLRSALKKRPPRDNDDDMVGDHDRSMDGNDVLNTSITSSNKGVSFDLDNNNYALHRAMTFETQFEHDTAFEQYDTDTFSTKSQSKAAKVNYIYSPTSPDGSTLHTASHRRPKSSGRFSMSYSQSQSYTSTKLRTRASTGVGADDHHGDRDLEQSPEPLSRMAMTPMSGKSYRAALSYNSPEQLAAILSPTSSNSELDRPGVHEDASDDSDDSDDDISRHGHNLMNISSDSIPIPVTFTPSTISLERKRRKSAFFLSPTLIVPPSMKNVDVASCMILPDEVDLAITTEKVKVRRSIHSIKKKQFYNDGELSDADKSLLDILNTSLHQLESEHKRLSVRKSRRFGSRHSGLLDDSATIPPTAIEFTLDDHHPSLQTFSITKNDLQQSDDDDYDDESMTVSPSVILKKHSKLLHSPFAAKSQASMLPLIDDSELVPNSEQEQPASSSRHGRRRLTNFQDTLGKPISEKKRRQSSLHYNSSNRKSYMQFRANYGISTGADDVGDNGDDGNDHDTSTNGEPHGRSMTSPYLVLPANWDHDDDDDLGQPLTVTPKTQQVKKRRTIFDDHTLDNALLSLEREFGGALDTRPSSTAPKPASTTLDPNVSGHFAASTAFSPGVAAEQPTWQAPRSRPRPSMMLAKPTSQMTSSRQSHAPLSMAAMAAAHRIDNSNAAVSSQMDIPSSNNRENSEESNPLSKRQRIKTTTSANTNPRDQEIIKLTSTQSSQPPRAQQMQTGSNTIKRTDSQDQQQQQRPQVSLAGLPKSTANKRKAPGGTHPSQAAPLSKINASRQVQDKPHKSGGGAAQPSSSSHPITKQGPAAGTVRPKAFTKIPTSRLNTTTTTTNQSQQTKSVAKASSQPQQQQQSTNPSQRKPLVKARVNNRLQPTTGGTNGPQSKRPLPKAKI